MQNNETHEKIIEILKRKGPSLPIQISKEIGMSSLFISAFLSELAGEKKVKISHMKIGGSPLYFLEGQENQLENFYNYLHPRESEALLLLKDKKILRDTEQKPAIRVALRSIRDFAVGFRKNEEIFWRYFLVPESEIQETIPEKQEKKLEIEPVTKRPKQTRKKQTPEIFLEEIKSYLKQKNMELVSLESFNKKEIIAKTCFIQNPDKINLLFAYNKKKIGDKDIIKSYKKAAKVKLDYMILSKGALSKKLTETIDAYKRLVLTDKL